MTRSLAPTVVVVGGSLAGLTTALGLAGTGCRVTVLERSGPNPRTGGALSVSFRELERVIGAEYAETVLSSDSGRRPGNRSGEPMLWTTLREGLRRAVDTEPLVELHHGARVASVADEGSSVMVTTTEGQRFSGDAVIGADGHRSIVRAALIPGRPDAHFAGYSLWIGAIKESELSRAAPSRGLFIEPSGPHYLLGYPLTDPGGRDRTLGWAWYDATRNALFRSTGAVDADVVQHTMRVSDVPAPTLEELAREAKQHWPSPWREAIALSVERREVTGIPIAEYVPERLAAGRLAIVGNAAHVPTPMTGSGFAASLEDAAAVAKAFRDITGEDVPVALAAYERARLAPAQQLVLSGQQFSRSFSLEA